MTTIQVRAGESSVCINGEDLLLSMHGLFRLQGDGDHLILEPAELRNADSALVEALRADLQHQKTLVQDAQWVITRLEGRLNAAELLKAPEHGTFVWAEIIQSDHPQKNPKGYRVCIYQLNDGFRGTCRCDDWQFQGLGRFDFSYRCKHIIQALTTHRAAAA